MKKVLILGVMCLLLCSCGDKDNKDINPGKITCDEMKELFEKNSNSILLDVRTKEEFNDGHLENAINIPVDNIEEIKNLSSINDDTHIIVYCRSGQRSSKAKEELNKIGYHNVYDLGAMSNCSK